MRHAQAALFALLLLAAPALADIAPTPKIRRVVYTIQVRNLTTFPDYRVVVFPWSASNGRPTTGLGVLEPDQGLPFGWSNAAQPALYPIKKDDLAEWTAKHPDDDGAGLMKSGKLVDCHLEIHPVKRYADGDPQEHVEIFSVVELEAGACRIVKGEAAPQALDAAAPSGKAPVVEPSGEGTPPPATTAPARTTP